MNESSRLCGIQSNNDLSDVIFAYYMKLIEPLIFGGDVDEVFFGMDIGT